MIPPQVAWNLLQGLVPATHRIGQVIVRCGRLVTVRVVKQDLCSMSLFGKQIRLDIQYRRRRGTIFVVAVQCGFLATRALQFGAHRTRPF